MYRKFRKGGSPGRGYVVDWRQYGESDRKWIILGWMLVVYASLFPTGLIVARVTGQELPSMIAGIVFFSAHLFIFLGSYLSDHRLRMCSAAILILWITAGIFLLLAIVGSLAGW